MANKFNIQITAIDNATATVRKINKQISSITAPIRQVKSSVANLGREVGLPRFSRDLGRVGRNAMDVASHVGSILAPMTAITGAATVGGIAELTREWAHLGWQTSITARTIGISTNSLQSLQGAARLAGISAGALTGGLNTLGRTMEDAVTGRNQAAMMMLNRIGVQLHRTAAGGVNVTRAFMDMSRAISRIKNPEAQAKVASTFGLEQVLPLLRQGPAAVKRYEASVVRFGAVMSGPQLLAAKRFGVSLTNLQLSVQGLRNSVAFQLTPVLQPLVADLTKWIAANRKLIALDVAHDVKELAQGLRSINWVSVGKGIQTFAQDLHTLVGDLGGVKTVAMAVAGIMSANMIVSTVKLGLALTSVATGGLRMLTIGLGAAGLKADALVGSMGRLGAVGLAGAGGYELGKHVINPALNAIGSKITGEKDWTIGNGIFQGLHGGYNPNAPDNGAAKLAEMRKLHGIVRGAHGWTREPENSRVSVDVHLHNAPPGTTAHARGTGRADVSPPRISHAMTAPGA